MSRSYRGKSGKRRLLVSAHNGILCASPPHHLDEPAKSSPRAELLHAAFQIHHGPAQYLASTLMYLRLCECSLRDDPSRAPALIRQSLASTQAALDSVRVIIRTLQIPQRKTPGITSLLRATIEGLRTFSTAAFQLKAGDVGPFPPAIEAGLAAVGCEALTNAARHAGARRITATLFMRRKRVILRVSDDGKGFDYAGALRRCSRHESMGLTLMREQIERLGGILHTQSSCAGGTLVEAIVPVSRRTRFPIPENSLPPNASVTV